MFDGKRVLITGASAGIGLSLAKAFSARGARVGLLAREAVRLEAAREEVARQGGEAIARVCDVTDAAALRHAVDGIAAAWGGLDGVVVNAGFCRPGRFHEIPLEALTGQINTNFVGAVHTLHAAMPHLLQSGKGSFAVITSSPAGELPIYGFNVYGATKAALHSLAEGLRQEYGTRGVHILTLLPPDTATPGYAEEVKHYPAATREILAKGRVYPPEAVADACLRALEAGKTTVTLGVETRMGRWLGRHFPGIWRWLCGRAIHRAGS
jgi:short-subunit dehydrogenase